jgi:NADH dehydrogenase [ubiquinone] 1 alpha subcomplex assembly factor 7
LTIDHQYSENVEKVLKPDKIFGGTEIRGEIKVGDSIEVCPGAITTTQEIMSLLEVSRGTALIIDYGEDHAFSNSFRAIKEHKLIKDFDQILEEVGRIDLTSYVNFAQIRKIAESNKSILPYGPMPQGLFLECMGITMRLELL